MVVGSRKTARARPCSRPHTGRSLVSASREAGKWLGPPTKRRALRAYRRVRPCPSPPPSGGVAPHRIPRLAAVACLARYVSSLAGVTFTPAQPPSVINSPCEKTNLTQKQPYLISKRREYGAVAARHRVHRCECERALCGRRARVPSGHERVGCGESLDMCVRGSGAVRVDHIYYPGDRAQCERIEASM